MVTWGHSKKKGQSYIKDKPKGMSGAKLDTNPTSDVHMKETSSMKGNREEFGNNLTKDELEKAKEKTKFWSYPEDWVTHKKHQIGKNEPYLYFNETGIHIMRPNDADYGRFLPPEQDFIKKKEFKTHNVRVYDNPEGGADRYTVFIGNQKEAIAMSREPFHPQGINMYVGEVQEHNNKSLGKKLQYDELPEKIKLAVQDRIRSIEAYDKSS